MNVYVALTVFLGLGCWAGFVVGYTFGLKKGVRAGVQFGLQAKKKKWQ
jgi:hypothetical protein